jgi:hypothetical protein
MWQGEIRAVTMVGACKLRDAKGLSASRAIALSAPSRHDSSVAETAISRLRTAGATLKCNLIEKPVVASDVFGDYVCRALIAAQNRRAFNWERVPVCAELG